jgi:hypothetical protein
VELYHNCRESGIFNVEEKNVAQAFLPVSPRRHFLNVAQAFLPVSPRRHFLNVAQAFLPVFPGPNSNI